jgi:ATP-dependent Lon protease
MPGKGKPTHTGQPNDVIKESAQTSGMLFRTAYPASRNECNLILNGGFRLPFSDFVLWIHRLS